LEIAKTNPFFEEAGLSHEPQVINRIIARVFIRSGLPVFDCVPVGDKALQAFQRKNDEAHSEI
jgi:hypothetical protein